MEPKTRKILIIALIAFGVVAVVLALTLGLVFGLKKEKDEDKDDVEIVNSYDNTEELIKKFPVINPTTVNSGLEKNIQNRLLTGFENWNRGFKAWKKWGTILYTDASIYNVHGARLTLAQYQASMDVTLKRATILMGDFHNMLICGDFAAIYYDIFTGEAKSPGTVMEFVRFKDYGDELGTRVVVGWGGPKDNSFSSMAYFQGDEEKMIQAEQELHLLNYQIPSDTGSDLTKKYPVLYPSDYTGDVKANTFINIILNGFEEWNKGMTNYLSWVENNYDNDAVSCGINRVNRTMAQYKEEMENLAKVETIEKLYFDNILIRDNWAALHYRYRRTIKETNEKSVGDRMQFLQFKEEGTEYKIEASFIK